jgi:hypothetical protein
MAGMESEQMSDIVNDNDAIENAQRMADEFRSNLLESVALRRANQVKIPASIIKAIVKVKKAVGMIAKDAENKHGNYRYASVDAIYAGVHEAMADAGLVCLQLEETVEKANEKYLTFTFSFILATEQDTWEDIRNQRSVTLQYMGPQSYQAAQSYCSKAFYKSLFLLQTGDPEQEGEETGEADAKTKKPARKEPKKMDVADATAFLGLVKGRIRNSKDMGELARVVDEHGGTVASLDEKFRAEVRAAYKAQETILTKSNGSA